MTEHLVFTDPVTATFKFCSNCSVHWDTLDRFMQDPTINLVGYMPTFDQLSNGLFLFNHGCGTTLACNVGQFEHLHNGPIFRENRHGADECPGYCQNKSDLSPCPARCSCAYVRDTMHIIKQWPKVQTT